MIRQEIMRKMRKDIDHRFRPLEHFPVVGKNLFVFALNIGLNFLLISAKGSPGLQRPGCGSRLRRSIPRCDAVAAVRAPLGTNP